MRLCELCQRIAASAITSLYLCLLSIGVSQDTAHADVGGIELYVSNET